MVELRSGDRVSFDVHGGSVGARVHIDCDGVLILMSIEMRPFLSIATQCEGQRLVLVATTVEAVEGTAATSVMCS